MTQTLKNIDLYGEPINLSYKGNSKYNTHLGGFVSLLVIVILGLYGVFNLYRLVVKGGTSTNTDIVFIDLQSASEVFPNQKYQFDVAFGVDGGGLDASLGYFTAQEVTVEQTGTDSNGQSVYTTTERDLDVELCGSSNFDSNDTELVRKIGIPQMYCVKDKSYAVLGNSITPVQKYVSIKLTPCDPTVNSCSSTLQNFFN